MERPYTVTATWDPEASVWVAESDDVTGLITEAETIPALLAKLRMLIPELLELNNALPSDAREIPFELTARVQGTAHMA